jgi:hypothetical protein
MVNGRVRGSSVKIFDQKKRHAAEMIAVQMAQKNHIETARIDGGALHRKQRARPAVQEKQPIGGFDQISALMASATAECIAAAENVEFHARRLFRCNRLTPRKTTCNEN